MVRTQINKKRHLIALIFTLVAFLIGILLGNLITKERTELAEEISQQQRLEAESIQLQYLYITSLLQSQNCPAIFKALEENLNTLEKARVRLENFILQNKEEQYFLIKRDYTLAEIRYWLLLKQTEDVCPHDAATLLYFYSDEENCKDCPLQGLILTTIKEKLDNRILIFSIDTQNLQEESMVSILKESFNITTLPTVIVNDDKVEGFSKIEEMYSIVCSQYTEIPEECKKYLE